MTYRRTPKHEPNPLKVKAIGPYHGKIFLGLKVLSDARGHWVGLSSKWKTSEPGSFTPDPWFPTITARSR
jgi:hypothetical protein